MPWRCFGRMAGLQSKVTSKTSERIGQLMTPVKLQYFFDHLKILSTLVHELVLVDSRHMFLFVSVFEKPFDECLKGFETSSSFFRKHGLIVTLGSVCGIQDFLAFHPVHRRDHRHFILTNY